MSRPGVGTDRGGSGASPSPIEICMDDLVFKLGLLSHLPLKYSRDAWRALKEKGGKNASGVQHAIATLYRLEEGWRVAHHIETPSTPSSAYRTSSSQLSLSRGNSRSSSSRVRSRGLVGTVLESGSHELHDWGVTFDSSSWGHTLEDFSAQQASNATAMPQPSTQHVRVHDVQVVSQVRKTLSLLRVDNACTQVLKMIGKKEAEKGNREPYRTFVRLFEDLVGTRKREHRKKLGEETIRDQQDFLHSRIIKLENDETTVRLAIESQRGRFLEEAKRLDRAIHTWQNVVNIEQNIADDMDASAQVDAEATTTQLQEENGQLLESLRAVFETAKNELQSACDLNAAEQMKQNRKISVARAKLRNQVNEYDAAMAKKQEEIDALRQELVDIDHKQRAYKLKYEKEVYEEMRTAEVKSAIEDMRSKYRASVEGRHRAAASMQSAYTKYRARKYGDAV